jgi:hypothetical protein
MRTYKRVQTPSLGCPLRQNPHTLIQTILTSSKLRTRIVDICQGPEGRTCQSVGHFRVYRRNDASAP